MREILYRGKRKDNGEWITGSYIFYKQKDCDNWRRSYVILTIPGAADVDGVPYEIYPETRCEFTGLTDKNGVKIFEGDIVKDDIAGYIYQIVWFNEHGGFYKLKDKIYEPINVFIKDIFVIGNIYDNPELMGGEKNICG